MLAIKQLGQAQVLAIGERIAKIPVYRLVAQVYAAGVLLSASSPVPLIFRLLARVG